MIIAIDGPAGAGKSVIAKKVAEDFGFLYVDSGAMFRGIGLYALRQGVDPLDKEGVVALLSTLDEKIVYVDGEQRILVNGEDVTPYIRTEEVSKAASDVSAILEVRDFLIDTQRNLAAENDIIMDGRDIGTYVFPKADLKIYLTATPEIRAERRRKQLLEKGIENSYEDILADIRERDYNDSHRPTRPLKQAEDAVYIDNTDFSLEEDIQNIEKLVKEKQCR